MNEKGKIIELESSHIVVEKGEWRIIYDLVPEKARTRIVSETRLRTSQIILVSVAFFLFIFATVFSWIQFTILDAYVQGLRSSLEGTLLEILGYNNLQMAQAVIGIFGMLPLFCILIAIVFGSYVAYSYYKREAFAERILSLLPQN